MSWFVYCPKHDQEVWHSSFAAASEARADMDATCDAKHSVHVLTDPTQPKNQTNQPSEGAME